MNEETRLRFQKSGTGDILGDIRNLKMTSVQRVMDLLERIDYEYKYDAGAAYGTLTEREVRYRYELLLGTLSGIPDLTEEDIRYLTSQIQGKVRDIPKVELASINEFLKNDAAVHKAVADLAAEKGISYEDAKKEFFSEMKERTDYYNKMIEDDQKEQAVQGGKEEPHDGREDI